MHPGLFLAEPIPIFPTPPSPITRRSSRRARPQSRRKRGPLHALNQCGGATRTLSPKTATSSATMDSSFRAASKSSLRGIPGLNDATGSEQDPIRWRYTIYKLRDGYASRRSSRSWPRTYDRHRCDPVQPRWARLETGLILRHHVASSYRRSLRLIQTFW
jgi:hypothetical protein